jgi:hypothetical protein
VPVPNSVHASEPLSPDVCILTEQGEFGATKKTRMAQLHVPTDPSNVLAADSRIGVALPYAASGLPPETDIHPAT